MLTRHVRFVLRRWLTVALSALALVGAVTVPAALPASASSAYSWGSYNNSYARSRVSIIPGSVPPGSGLYTNPWIVPTPNPAARSQSTPVVVGNTIYFFAYTSASRGALYSSTFTAAGTPGPAVALVHLTAKSGETFNSPGDPSVSPDGKWLAFAAGYDLYWWRIGDWCAANSSPSCPSGRRLIPPARVNAPAFVSSAPTFVSDPASGSGGWSVCSGSNNGGFACYALVGVGSVMGTNLPFYTTRGNGITSSAVVVPGGGPHAESQVCFGVASWRARIVCLNPLGAAVHSFGQGEIHGPVDAALAYADGALYATGQYGGVYSFNPNTGAMIARNRSPVLTGGGFSIAPPSVDPGSNQVFTIANGYESICDLTLHLHFWGPVSQACYTPTFDQVPFGGLTAATITRRPGQRSGCVDVWDASDSGILGAMSSCNHTPAKTLGAYDGTQNHNFSAAVAGVGPGSSYLVMWSDGAVNYWRSAKRGTFVPSSFQGTVGGGLQVWKISPALDAWAVHNPVVAPPHHGVPSGGECVYALAATGTFSSVTMSTVFQSDVSMQRAPNGTNGVVPGCPVSSHGSPWQALQAQWGHPSVKYSEAGGTTNPAHWRAGSQFWVATNVVVPSGLYKMPVYVAGTEPSGGTVSATAWIYTNCPSGEVANAANKCVVPAPPQHHHGECTPYYCPQHRPPCHVSPTTPWWVCKYPPKSIKACLARADHCVGGVLVPTRGPKGQPWPTGS